MQLAAVNGSEVSLKLPSVSYRRNVMGTHLFETFGFAALNVALGPIVTNNPSEDVDD